ncbi:MAG: hypothetical protein COB34_07875, partial [Methylophilaceae bacterium]
KSNSPKSLNWQSFSTDKSGQLILENFISRNNDGNIYVMIDFNSSINQSAKFVFETTLDLKVWNEQEKELSPVKNKSGKWALGRPMPLSRDNF